MENEKSGSFPLEVETNHCDGFTSRTSPVKIEGYGREGRSIYGGKRGGKRKTKHKKQLLEGRICWELIHKEGCLLAMTIYKCYM